MLCRHSQLPDKCPCCMKGEVMKHNFRVGERVFLTRATGDNGKYNTHAVKSFPNGTAFTVVEPPNEGFPKDAVQVRSSDPTGEGAIEARLLHSILEPMVAEEEFVTVRIAVAISPDGSWQAYGSEDESSDMAVRKCKLWLQKKCEEVRWVEAQIPLPKPQSINTIKGKVCE